MSRQFIGNQNIVYTRLKKLTNIPSEVELHKEIDDRIGTKPMPNSERKAAASARKSSLAIRNDNSAALAPQAPRRSVPQTARSVSAINIRNQFAKKTPLKS